MFDIVKSTNGVNMNYEAKFIHINEKNQFVWTILINGVKFDFHQGLGHCKAKRAEGHLAYNLPQLGTNGNGYNKESIELRASIIRALNPFKNRVSLWDCEQLPAIS